MTHYHQKQTFECISCLETKPNDAFYYHKTRHLRIKTCRECNKQKSKKYQSVKRETKDIKFILQVRSADIRRRMKNHRNPAPVAKNLRHLLCDLWEKQNGLCFYTGLPMSIGDYHTNHLAVTVDRISPKLGYVEGNVVLCCRIINAMKQDLELEELKQMCKLLLEHMK